MEKIDLTALYNEATKNANDSANWYSAKKVNIKRASRGLRSVSIMLVGMGTLFPLLGGILKGNDTVTVDVTSWGYIAIALAGTLILYDRFFGFSTAWIRYITTELEIRKQIAEFELKWKVESCGVETQSECNPKTIELVNLIKSFRSLIDELVKSETQTWAAEFQTNFSELEKTINAKVQTSSPGVVKVTITGNLEKVTDLHVKTDNLPGRAISTNTTLLQGLSVGYHLVTVTGKQDGKIIEVAEVVNVEAGKLTAIDVKIP